MAKVTYLLGAGASIGSLPVVEKFEDEIKATLLRLRQLIYHTPDDEASKDKGDVGKIYNAINELQWLLGGCNRHRSVDTFAKMLFLTSKNSNRAYQYRRVKRVIVLFFDLYRYFTKNTDKRYHCCPTKNSTKFSTTLFSQRFMSKNVLFQ